MNNILCPDAVPSFLGVFDFSIAPSLLFYSYIPIFVLSLAVGFFIYATNKSSHLHKIVFLFIATFAFWVLDVLILWTAAQVSLVMFFWQILALIEVTLYSLAIYLVYIFARQKTASSWTTLAISLPPVIVSFFLASHLNLSGFDLQNCEAITGPVWNFIYGFEVLAILAIAIIGIKNYFSNEIIDRAMRPQIPFIVGGTVVFLTIFSLTNILGDATKLYSINLFGPIGMIIFVGFLGYLMVRYQAFGVKVLAARALVIALIALIASEYFFIHSAMNYILVSFTLALTLIFGLMLVKSVQKEVEQRERIEALAKDLEKANSQQVTLIHFITHQIKGFVTKSRNIFSMALEGDFGPVGEQLRPMIQAGFDSDTKGVNTIQEILNASNIKSGKVTYKMAPFDLRALIEEISRDLKPQADAKGVALNLDLGTGATVVKGDRTQLINAFKNLIDNSIKYTQKGEVDVSIKQEGGKTIFEIEDTGVGITPDDMKNLFTEGGHGKDSTRVNVESTGFGLYIVKNIVDAHKGRVWAESEGAGKGSRFIVELPSSS